MVKNGLEMSSKMALKTVIKKGAKKTIFKSDFFTDKPPACPVLCRAIEYSNAAGMNGQPVYAFNGDIKPLFTDSKKGVKKHRELQQPLYEKVVVKKWFSRDLATASLVQQDIAKIKEHEATKVTYAVSLSGKVKIRIDSSSYHADAYEKVLKEHKLNEPTVMVCKQPYPVKVGEELFEALSVEEHSELQIYLYEKVVANRWFSRDLETAFLALQDIAQIKENQATIVFGTVNFSLKTRIKINSTSDLAYAYGKLLRERNWHEPTIIVLESGSKGSKTITHAHIITIVRETPESDLKRLKSLLKKDNPTSSSAVLVSPNYLFKQPYTQLIELEEEQFGALPTEEGLEHPYWLSSWREPESNEVKRRVPVNIACCDYLSKELSTKQASKRYGFINFGNLRGMKVKERIQATRAFNAKYKSTSK